MNNSRNNLGRLAKIPGALTTYGMTDHDVINNGAGSRNSDRLTYFRTEDGANLLSVQTIS